MLRASPVDTNDINKAGNLLPVGLISKNRKISQYYHKNKQTCKIQDTRYKK